MFHQVHQRAAWDYTPPPLPQPRDTFHESKMVDSWTRVEAEECLIVAVPQEVIDVLEGESRARIAGRVTDPDTVAALRRSVCRDERIWRAVDGTAHSLCDDLPALARRQFRAYACSCGRPEVFVFHREWIAHRRHAEHARTVRDIVEARLLHMFEKEIAADARRFIHTQWWSSQGMVMIHPGMPVGAAFANQQQQQQQPERYTGAIGYGPVCFDACPEHSQQGERCPSWTMVVEAFANLEFGPLYRLRMGSYIFGSHGTSSGAIRPIACKSLDPARRRGGYNEYYGDFSGSFCEISYGYAGAADRMFIFCEWTGDHIRDGGNGVGPGHVAPLLDPVTGRQVPCERVVMNPLDTEPGRPPMRFMLPVLIAAFEPHQNMWALQFQAAPGMFGWGAAGGAAAAAAEQTRNAQIAQMQRQRQQRHTRLERELQMLRHLSEPFSSVMTSMAERMAHAEDKVKGVLESDGFSKARNVFSGDAQFFNTIPSRDQLRKALADESLSTKKDGMKGVLAQMCLGQDMSSLFPDVVKNIHAPSIELRKFIYTYIVHHCDERPNEALLSISAFQKDLLDRSIHVRSLALRVLSSIRISSIQPVVMLAIKKCMTDVAPLVRRTAAIALIKAFRISKGDSTDQSAEVIAKLLGDRVMDVAGAAAAAWMEICPTRYDLVHREYRRLCRGLTEAGDSAQIAILRMLLRYCRANFSDPNKQIEEKQEARKNSSSGGGAAAGGADKKKKGGKDSSSSSDDDSSSSDSDADKKKQPKKKDDAAAKKKDDSDPGEDEYESFFSGKKGGAAGKKAAPPASAAKKGAAAAASKDEAASSRASSPDMDLGIANDIDNDHRLLLTSAKPLLFSANRAVVLHAIAVYYHCAPNDMLDQCAKPLLRVLNGPRECVLPALVAANSFISKRHKPLIPYVQDFFPLPTDSLNERDLKLRIMAKLATRDNLPMLTKELGTHFRVMEVKHTISAVQGMSLIAFSVPNTSRDILRQLLPLLAHRNSDVVSEVVVALRQVVCLGHDPTQTLRTIQQLARGILTSKITTPEARASVLWLVADNLKSHPTITKMAPDMFRTFLATFKDDAIVVRRQLLFLGQKIFLHMDADNELTARFKQMLQYLLELLKFDADYDLRDAGGMLSAALDRSSDAFRLLKAADDHRTAHKPAPEIQDPFGDRSALELTSMSHLVGFSSLKYTDLPLWADTCSASSLRDPPEPKLAASPLDDDSDSTTTTESASSKASAKGGDSDSSSSSSDDDDDGKAKKPTGPAATTAAAPAPAAKPKIQVSIKTISKPSAPQPGKGDRILKDFFTATPAPKPGAKPAPAANAAKHADPSPNAGGSSSGSDDE